MADIELSLSVEDKVLLAQASSERAQIVAKYDKGREEGAEIDKWEDPEFEVYHVTDRYGFIHDHELPRVSDLAMTKAKEVEVERTQKWLKMSKNWDKYSRGDKVARRIYKGIPEKLRGHIWSLILDVENEVKAHPHIYENMRERARRHSPDIRQIDLDVNRTYRNHIMFRKRFDVKQQALFHVLAAYSMYNTEVGYCQGMSQIAALLLMYFNEEDAFWALSVLMSDAKHAMHGLFIPGFPKLRRFQEHHDRILKKFLPKIRRHLEKNDMYVDLYTIKWLMQCFLDRVPFRLALRLWDIYMFEGERLLVAMGYNLIKMHARKLQKMSMEDLMDFFQGSLEKDFGYDDDRVIESLKDCMEELRRSNMDLPPPAADDAEIPKKPFGVVVTPTIEQLIGRRTMVFDGDEVAEETEGGIMVIPADGGPVVAPVRQSMAFDNRPSSVGSSSVLDHYDTATDGMSSRRISMRDGRSSVTSFVDEFLDVEDEDLAGDGNQLSNDAMEVDEMDVNTDVDDWKPWQSGVPNGADVTPEPIRAVDNRVRVPPRQNGMQRPAFDGDVISATGSAALSEADSTPRAADNIHRRTLTEEMQLDLDAGLRGPVNPESRKSPPDVHAPSWHQNRPWQVILLPESSATNWNITKSDNTRPPAETAVAKPPSQVQPSTVLENRSADASRTTPSTELVRSPTDSSSQRRAWLDRMLQNSVPAVGGNGGSFTTRSPTEVSVGRSWTQEPLGRDTVRIPVLHINSGGRQNGIQTENEQLTAGGSVLTSPDTNRTIGNVVCLNQSISVISVVNDGRTNDEAEQLTPTVCSFNAPAPHQRFVTTIHSTAASGASGSSVTPTGGGATGESMVRDFFAPAAEPWSNYMRTSPPSSTQRYDHSSRPIYTRYHQVLPTTATSPPGPSSPPSSLQDAAAASGSRSYRPTVVNGLSVQAVRHYPITISPLSTITPQSSRQRRNEPSPPSAVISVGSVSRNSPVSAAAPPVVSVRSKVTSPTGNQVGSKVMFSSQSAASSPVYSPPPVPPKPVTSSSASNVRKLYM